MNKFSIWSGKNTPWSLEQIKNSLALSDRFDKLLADGKNGEMDINSFTEFIESDDYYKSILDNVQSIRCLPVVSPTKEVLMECIISLSSFSITDYNGLSEKIRSFEELIYRREKRKQNGTPTGISKTIVIYDLIFLLSRNVCP